MGIVRHANRIGASFCIALKAFIPIVVNNEFIVINSQGNYLYSQYIHLLKIHVPLKIKI